jgi:hypothetical protein
MGADFDFISREELLEGLPGRRASTLLFAIENRTAQLVAREHQETAVYLAESASTRPEQAFLEAIVVGRELPVRPTIQQIERFAPHWASLVPPASDARGRAAIAHALGQKYTFTQKEASQLQAVLGLADAAVQAAYQRLYGQPLDGIYAPQIGFADRLRWAWTGVAKRLENLPPFWLAVLLCMPGSAGLLALPIVLAPLGLGMGLVILVAFALLNILTVVALAETVARSGTARFGLGFLGQLVHEYLGNAGSLLLTVVLMANNFVVLIIFFLGVAGTLESSTSLPAELWVGVTLVVCLYFLSRRSLNATVASTLVIVLVNALLLFSIPLLSLTRFQPENLVLTASRDAFTLTTLGPVLGVMLSTYLSHFLIATYGPVVLRRDPSARAWIRGSAAAILFFMLVACLWVVTANGVIPADLLSDAAGTVLVPLAEQAGPAVKVLGTFLVALSLGLAAIQVSLAQYYSIQERFPASGAPNWFGRLGERGRFFVAISPMFPIFLLTEWVALTGSGSFARLLGFLGALALPLLSGMFPLLLLASTRRKGDFVPGVVYRLAGNRVLLAAAYLFFLGSIFVYGLFIWETAVERLITLLTGTAILAVTVLMLRRGALDRRLVVELRDDRRLGMQGGVTVTDGGDRAVATIQLHYPQETQTGGSGDGLVPDFSRLQGVDVELPETNARQLKVWAHRLTPEGLSQGLAARLAVHGENMALAADLITVGGQAFVPLNGTGFRLEIRLTQADTDEAQTATL